jgi:glycosyltransferase involved in cell wall biosynthesis
MAKIKLTNINPTDIKGGASLAGYRLHKELLGDPEIDSVIFVNQKYTKDKEVIRFSNFFLWQIERILNKISYFTGLLYLFSVNWLPFWLFKRFRQTDVFLIRSIHGGFLPFWLPWRLSKKAPVIWRFPDMWALTGHCAFAYNCLKWQKECGQCPLLKDYPAIFIDTSRLLFRWKKYFYSRSNLHLVAPSKWMLENIKKSPILRQLPSYYIPIGIDTELFKPISRREKFTLIIVSGSLKDKRKGANVLPGILRQLDKELKNKNIFLDIFWVGEKDISAVEFNKLSNINNIFVGHKKESELAEYYGQSHLHILPTLADNLPNTIIESLACQTPVVVFDIGGCSDAVKHLKTGYLAEPANAEDFVRGIMYFLNDSKALEACGKAGRELVKQQFTSQLQAQRYKALIKQVYQENKKKL